MRIRAAKIEELTPKPRARALSPRQLAALQREEEIRKALTRLKSDEDVIALELDPAEKIPTMRAAVKRAIAAHKPGTNMAIRGRTIYLSTGRLPGGRGGRRAQGALIGRLARVAVSASHASLRPPAPTGVAPVTRRRRFRRRHALRDLRSPSA